MNCVAPWPNIQMKTLQCIAFTSKYIDAKGVLNLSVQMLRVLEIPHPPLGVDLIDYLHY